MTKNKQMEFLTRRKVPKSKLSERESVPASPVPPSGVRSGRQVPNRSITTGPPTVVVPQPYLTPVNTKKDDKQISVSSQIPVRRIPPPKFLPPRNPPAGEGVKSLTRSHSDRSPNVGSNRRRKDLAYLVVDLQSGKPTYSGECGSRVDRAYFQLFCSLGRVTSCCVLVWFRHVHI